MKSRGFEKKKRKSFSEGGVASPIISFMCILFLFTITSYSFAQDFTAKSIGDYGNVTVMEVTGNYDAKNSDGTLNSEPRQAIAKEFFRTHKDEYDFVVIFSNFDFQMPDATSKAFYLHVKNDIQGIGRQPFDYSSLFGSNGKLQGVIDMGNAATIVADPLDPKFEETLSILAHEQMHRWGAYVKFKDSTGNISTSLLGLNLEHWSFLLDSYGSVLYGNKWQDNGNGTFTSIATEKYYSPLDLYLMGFNDKTQVPSMLLVNNPDIDPARMPETGATITGTPGHVSIDDIIAAEGERIPGSADSQKTFKTAFIFITAPGTFTGNELYGIENIRNGWVTRFSALTDGKGIMQVASTPVENIPINPGPILPPITPRTLPPNIDDGVKWLMANQKGDGSWMDLSQTTDRDTAEVVLALKNFSVAQQNYSLGSQWLSADDSENIDYLSRKIDAFANSGQDASALIALLISKQNPDGGWGSNNTYMSNPADTSLALKALSIAGSSNQTVISAAIEYLKLRQNADGGWGNDDGGSTIEPTANVLSAFSIYRNNYQMEDQITKGFAWLIQRQNPDGGFGNSPSTVYDTAIATVTLRAFNVSTDITNNGLNYLLSQQSASGSWNESPYQTALAINAVWKATIAPDLSVKADDITFIPSVITSLPTNLVMNVNIWNLGRTDVSQAKVALYKGSISEANKIGEQVVAFPGQSSVTVTFSVAVNDGNEHIYYISIDPENLIQESNKSNNTALKILYPQSTYDFEILPSDITVSQNPVDIFNDIKITSKITNKGTMNAYNVQLKYFIDDLQSSFDIATATVDLPAGATITNEITWRANKAGVNLPVTVLVDPFNTFTEISKANNKAVTYLTVNGATLPNLTISYKDIVITPSPANQGGNANISVLIKNEGFSAVQNVKVNFYKGTPGVDGVLIGSQTVPSLNSGDNSSVSIDWTNIPESGERIIYTKVDPDNQITEISKDDNAAFTTLKILSLPDLAISSNSISFTPPAPKDGDTVLINVTVQNRGEQGASDFSVRANEGNTVIGSKVIPSIAGNSQASASFIFDTTGKSGAHQITVIVDPDNTITEQSKDNNSASRSFGVQNANLWLTEQYISPNGDGVKDSTQFFFRLSSSQTVKIVVVNGKGQTVRTFAGNEFENTTNGNIIWDGLNDAGMVVDDGQYQIKIVDVNNNVLGSLLTVVDNNRSPLTDAIGTKYLLNNNLTCKLPEYLGEWRWLPDDSGLIFSVSYSSPGYPEYPKGLYKMSPTGDDIIRVIPAAWSDDNYDYYPDRDGILSPDGNKVAFELWKYYEKDNTTWQELWTVDTDGRNLRPIVQDKREYLYGNEFFYGIGWSPDSKYLAYNECILDQYYNCDHYETVVTNTETLEIISTHEDARDGHYWENLNWSLDGNKIAYPGQEGEIVIFDISNGGKNTIFLGQVQIQNIQWLGSEKIIVETLDSTLYYGKENLWLVDAINGNKTTIIPDDQGTQELDFDYVSYNISPDKKSIAISRSFRTASSQEVKLYVSDLNGNTSLLHELSHDSVYCSPGIGNIYWSSDSRTLHFTEGLIDSCGDCPSGSECTGFFANFVEVDVLSKNKKVTPVPLNIFMGWFLWIFSDERTALAYFPSSMYGGDHIGLIDLQTGSDRVLFTDWSTIFPVIYEEGINVSPKEHYIAYFKDGYQSDTCVRKYRELWAISSLLNLTSDLRITKEKSAIILKGSAADLNFEGYKLEYADTNNSNVWNLITPPSDTMVLNDVFTTWIPPYEGIFYVRLTVWDKAGNVTTNRKRVSWGLSSSITNIYKSQEIFSPNGDGVKDTVALNYTVLEPVHLEFNIYDENDKLIRTFLKDYTAYAVDYITWDGRDENGRIVPDGIYKIKVFDYEFFLEVDNTPPDIGIQFVGLIDDKDEVRDHVSLVGHSIDNKQKDWIVEYSDSSSPEEWYEYAHGETQLVWIDSEGNLDPTREVNIDSWDGPFEWLFNKKFRITAEDYAGNKSSQTTDFLPEQIVIYKWKDIEVIFSPSVVECGDEIDVTISLFEGADIIETIRNDIAYMIVQYKKDEIWHDIRTISYPINNPVEILLSSSQFDLNASYNVRVKAVDTLSNAYYSNSTILDLKNLIYHSTKIIGCPPMIKLNVSYDEVCGQISNKAFLATELKGLSDKVALKTLSYYIQKPEGLQLLRQLDIPIEGLSDITIDTSNMSEGTYPVKATLSYLDLNDNKIKEVTATNTVIVDRILPTAQITYPGKSLMICPIKVSDAKGDWFGIPVEGVAIDNINVKRYEIYYGFGNAPATWEPAATRQNGKPVSLSANGPKQGKLGTWDVTNLKGTAFSLKLKVVDVAGNVSCTTTSFSVDDIIEITRLITDKSLFSPNSDSVLDDVKIDCEINEYAKVDVKVYKLLKTADGSYTLDSTSIRTIISGQQHLSGTENTSWDGKDDSGTIVPDGLYGIAVFATDSCSNTNMRWIDVEIDNTPPTTIITYPRPPDPLGNIVEVEGTADDLHFQSYTLETGQGDNPDTWTLISSNTQPVEDDILGTWNTFGLDGRWTLRLTAIDTAGNKNIATVTIDLGARKNLIKDLNAAPRLFSPNNDGRLDTVNINYELTDSCQVKIDILDAASANKKTYTTVTPSLGTYTFIWDGRDNSGMMVPDGAYTAKLSAALSSNLSVTQEESVTIIVDSTLPTIDIKQPLNNSYLKGDIVINGTIVDNNILEYFVNYLSDVCAALVDKGNQNRENYTFGVLNTLPEGNYILNVKAKDLGENITENNIAFVIDRTPPKVIFDIPKEGEFYGFNKNTINTIGSLIEKNLDLFSLRYGSGDNPLQWVELLGGNTIPGNPQLFSWKVGKGDGVADGLYTLSLFAKDKAGSTGESRVKVTIDNTVPEVLITSPQNGGYVKTPVDIKGTASDTNLEKYTLELSEGQCSSAFKWGVIKTGTISIRDGALYSWQVLPSDGNYCFRLTAVDKLGNTSEAKTNVKVDTHPPMPPVLSGKVENKSNVSLTWTQNTEPDLAGYNLYRDAQKINTVLIKNPNFLDQNLKEGIYAYTVTSVDLAGNESKQSNEVKLRVNLSAPDAKISSPKDGSSVSGIVDIKGTAYSADDFKQYRIYIGQGSSPSIWNLIRTSPVPISYGTLVQWDTLGLKGLYSIKLEAEDLTGNINTHQIVVTVDDTAPAPPVLISAIPNGSDVTLKWQANTEPDLAGYLLYRNNQLANVSGIVIGDLKPYLISGTTYLDKLLPDGKFKYYLIAMDQAGNQSGQSNMIEVNIDTHPPHATIVEPADKSKFQNKILIKADSPDIDIESVQFQYKKVQDSVWINLGSPVTQTPYIAYLDPSTSGLAYGDYNLRAVAVDKGGKTDPAPGFITVTYTDLTAPEAPKDLKALTNGKDVTLTWTANAEADLDGYNVYRTSGSSKIKINTTVIKEATYQDRNISDGAYTYEVTAVDTNIHESNPSNSASAKIYVPELLQPYTPSGNKTIEIKGSNASASSTVEIFNQNTSGSSSAGTVNADTQGNFTFANLNLVLGENRITARATDAAGNISRTTDALVVVYDEPPSPPTGLTKSLQDYNVTLTWNQNTESDLSGYNLFRNSEKLNTPVAIEAGTITASSYDDYSPPENAFDSDTSTYWMSNYSYDTFNPVWLEIDLPSPELITHIEIHWFNDWNDNLYLGKDYEIQMWSGYAWITQTKVTGNAETDNIFDFKPSYRTDKIRIYITDITNTDYYKQVGISEIEILKDNLISDPSYQDANLHDGNYTYKVTAVNYYGFESTPSEETEAAVGDVTPPAAPQNLTATTSGSDVILIWSSNTEPDLAGYNVFRNTPQGWLKINTSLLTTNTYTDGNLLNGTYTYRVTAVDAVGNESMPSNEAIAQIAIPLLQPPINLHISSAPEGKALNISWEYSGGSPSGYNLFRSNTSGGPYTKVNTALLTSTAYLDTGLTNGMFYYYVVAAVDLLGNESAYSNEAVGIPSDTVAPHQPVIFFPTKPGNPILLYNEKTDISGIAEPASVVELFKDGDSAGKTTSLGEDIISSFPFSSSVYNASLSPDGRTLAYRYNSSIWLRNLATGGTTMLIQKGTSPCWAPDGRKLAYIFYDSSNYSRIGIYDVETGTGNPLTDDTNVSENYPSWSSDGTKIAFRSNKGSSWNAWIKDIETGSLKQVTNGISVSVMKLSPDGEKLAYFKSSELYVMELTNNTTDQIDIKTDGYSLDWSPDSKKLAFISKKTGNSNLFLLDMNIQDQIQITYSTDYIFTPIWSPDGNSIALGRLGNNGYSVWIMDAQANETGRVLKQNLSYVDGISWVKSGAIAFLEPTIFDVAYMEGYFNFKDIPLDPGENLFSAVSADESGNTSPPSDEISVIFDTDLLPDIEVTEDDISIYPPYPLAGQTATVTAVIRNTGMSEVKDIDTDVYLWDPQGNITLMKSENISSLLPQSEIPISFTLDTASKTGTNKIIVVIDPQDKIHEGNETDNMAIKEFFVVEKEGVTLTTTLDFYEYRSNQDVNILIDFKNSGIEKDGTVETWIEDEGAQRVATIDTRTVQLPYAAEQNYSLLWNTDSTYAGSYRVHTVLKDGVNVITECNVPFAILPDINIDSSVVTSKIAYGPNEDVFMTINVKNNGNNYVIPGLDVKVKVMDASNNILFNETKNIINLFPGASNNINSTWNTGILSAGNYTIVVEIYRNDELILSKSVSFMINASSIIKGSITVSPTVVLAGGSVQVGYAVKNTGNTAMNGLSLNLFIIDPETQTIMSTYGEVIDLGINTTKSGGFSFSTQGYALKTYTASFQYVYQGNTKTIATAAFTVKDVTPPVVNIVSPISGNSYSSRFDIVVIAADGASGVNSVEYRIDSGGWKLLPVTDLSSGRYSTSWTPSAEDGGPHTISVRATDKAGNTSAVISVTITVAQSPPTGTIAINNNDLYTNNADVTLTFHATDSSGSAVAKMCISNTTSCTAWEAYTETKAWTLTPGDGTKTVYVWYQDSLGNAGTMPFSDSISLDTTSPGSDIVSPLSGATIMGMTINIKGTAFDNGSLVQKVEVSTDGGATWNSVTSTTSWSYEWTVSADGTYTIKSRATDNAGNVEIPGIGTTVSVYKRQPSNISTSGRQLLVNSNPFTIKGVVYSPVPIGEDPETTPPYGDYFTFNYTGIYDRDLPLLRQMGANALRLWTWDGTADHHDFLDIAYNGGTSPIYIIVGYQINPGSDIYPQSPNNVRQQLKADFRAMVAAHKNHPAILMWAIGNDLNGNEMYSENLDNLFSLINEMAAEVHQEEGSNYHPVTAALINSNIIPTVSAYDAAVPSLDVWGVNVYPGNTFGTLFDDFKAVSSKPLAILEYGIDAFDSVNGDEYENIGAPYQAIYAEALWNEIEANSDVCIGGSIMEYSDEWWKGKYSTEPGCPDNNPALHSICGYSISTEPDEYTNEEWWGIVRTAYNDSGTDTMETRAVYYTLQELWGASTNEPHISISPNTADFGSIAVGDITPIQLFTFSNAGMDNLAISTITLSGINAFEFIKQNDHCSGHTLVPSKTCTLQVVFSPATAGSKSATLSVPSDDPITPTVYVGLSGTATVSISGAVTDGQSPLSEVIMTLSGAASATTTTDASGNYKFSGLINGGYTVTPNKTGFMFTPTSSSFIISGGDLMDLNFTGAITTFTVTPSAGTGGSISPSSPQTVNYDGTASFTVTPSTGYHIADVVVDGVSQGEISSYTFTNVVANHIISASFEITTGVFGDTGVRISGGGYIDSYNSSNGPYDGSHGANGPVGTNSTAKSAITLSGGAKVYGDVWVGPGGDPNKVIKTSGGAVIYGTKGALSSAKDMTPMADPGGGTPVSFTKGTTLTSGTYRVSSANLSGNGIGTIDGNVTLYVTGNMSVSGNSKILILPGGSLTVYVSGNINISGGGIVNQALNPHTLIIYGTSTCTTANYSGGSALYGAIYTPKANITISGGSSVYGTVVGSYVTISGGAAVHCDESL